MVLRKEIGSSTGFLEKGLGAEHRTCAGIIQAHFYIQNLMKGFSHLLACHNHVALAS